MFNCNGCGLCCQRVGELVAASLRGPEPFSTLAADFPYTPDASGRCPQLAADNTCQVYADRPLFCRVDETFDQFLSGTLTRDDWHLLNYKGCEALQDPVQQ